jgi:hypothetical protein
VDAHHRLDGGGPGGGQSGVYPLAFLGASGWTPALVVKVLVTNWALKVSWEVILTPVTYFVVGFLKRAEGVDVFDTHTNFTPFSAKV